LSDLVGLIRSLSNAYGPPGNEEEVRKILRNELEGYADDVRVDKLGNIFFSHHGEKGYPRVMLAAHMDEVALMVTFIEKNGFLRFHPVGGVTSNVLPGHTILLRGVKGDLKGVIGTKPPHLMKEEERNKPISMEDLFIDIGAESLEEAEAKDVEVGTIGVFDVNFAELGGGYIMGKAFDDRAGCTVLIEAFKSLKDSPCNLVAVGTIQEEMGLRGARTAAWQTDPDYALALEGTFAADVPGSRPDMISSNLKAGPIITIMDRSIIAHPTILRILTRVGKEKAIPFQFKKVPLGGTDAGAIHLEKAGVPTGTVSVPCRYIHGPVSVAHIDDIGNTAKLVAEFVKAVSQKQ